MRYILKVLLSLILLQTSIYADTKPLNNNKVEKAIFAGGCFWCTEADFDKVPGVIETISGFTGGTLKNPTYEQVSRGGTGHFESVLVTFDPSKISYQALVNYFWHHVDPTDSGGQFCDRGDQYRTAIFYFNNEQKKLADESKTALLQSHLLPQVDTAILPASTFYPAEEYHQDYHDKHALLYRLYRYKCGRDARIEAVWKNKI